MAIPPAWATTTDVITASDLAATSTTLAYFTEVSKPSGAVYAGRTAKHTSGAIFLTTKNANSGMVSTTSGGKIKSVTFTFNQNTDKYSIEVYGKNTAYTSSSDLTDASTKGTLLGTTNAMSTVITVSGDYEYIGIISNNTSSSSKILLDNIQFEWEANGPKLEVGAESLTINDSGSNNSFSVTGSGLIDNVGLSRSSSSITPSLSTTVGSAVNNDNGNWYFIHNDGSLTGTVAATYEGRELTATDIFTLGTNKNNDGEDITIPVEVTYQPNIYVIGNFGNAGWQYGDGSHPMTYSKDGNTITYTATLENVPANSYIMFTRKTGETYYWEGDYNRLFFGAQTDGGDWGYGTNTSGNLDTDPTDEYPVKYHPIYFSEAGNYTITINAAAKTFSITKVLPQVATPVISPESGNFTETQQVTMTCETSGATIYYTTDGSTPTTSSSVYSSPLTVSETTTIKAIAVLNGYTDSEVAEATYTKVEPSSDFTIFEDGTDQSYLVPFFGYYHDTQNTTIQVIYPADKLTALNGTTIKGVKFYTVNGVHFSDGSNTVTIGMTDDSSFSSTAAMTISGSTASASFVPSTDMTEIEIEFNPGLEYTSGKNLIIQTVVSTAGTCDNYSNYTYFIGETQDYNCAYNNKASYGSAALIKFLPKATFSFVSSTPSVATPTFSPAAGTYNSVQQVTISCETEGATISYSTDDGTTWTPYTSAITVSETTTIMAKASKSGMTTSEASAEYIIDIPEDYAVTVSPDGGTIDFGTVDNEAGATKSKTITVTNTGLQPVTPTLSALTAPFSTDYTPVQLASGESVTITITFTPTEEGTFDQNATLSFGNGIADRSFTLNGKGGKYNENDHSAIYDKDYTWIDANGNPQPSNLLETAYEPEHIIAMLREIYMNPDIPGNKVRGFTETGDPESLMINGNDAFAVNYSAVGQLNSSLEYVDQYGWNIPTSKPILSRTAGSNTYNYFDPTEYTPHDEGLTLIMLELKDGVDFAGNSSYYSFGSSALSLRDKVANTFKSARIITTYKKSGSGEEAGTLFKIDADKLNRFFFLAKGQLRIIDHGQAYESDWTNNKVQPFPSLKGSTFTDNSFNESSGGAVLAPFEHMFEQFSPNQANISTSAMTDVYQELVNMESYDVIHDCVSIPYVAGNHEFNMYGVDSESDDCQDVRDMMFFVPDYRMKFWKASEYAFGDNTRDPNSVEKFVNYNQDHRPTLGLYVIRQNEITGDKQANADVYDLNLSWESNLLDFLPGAEAMYQLFRVVTDEFGNKTYELVVTLDPNETTYIDHVAMAQHGQQVTYVVQGQDQTKFLSLQMSNEESYIIPGLDKSEIFTLSSRFDHYSRFDPLTESNYYANQLKVVNNTGTNIKGAYMGNGAKFTFLRGTVSGNDTTWVAVAEATSNGNGSLAINTNLPSQNRSGLYTHNNLDWIKMNNPSTVSYTVDGSDNVTFSNFNLFDNFRESVAQNDHHGFYIYKVDFEAPAGTTIQGTQGNTAHSNMIGVAIHKTDMNVLGYSKNDIDLDKNHELDATTRPITEQVKYSSKTEILRYDLYRWNENDEGLGYIIDFANSTFNPTTGEVDEQDEAPTGIAGNQAGEYTISMDGVNQNENNVTIAQGETKWATFVDNAVQDVAGMYTYAPVVETFTSRGDYNTYGAPVQLSGVATIKAEVMDDYVMSVLPRQGSTDNGVWTVNDKQYCHYTVKLKLSELQIPGDEANQLKDYDLYKIRVWRQVPADLVGEQVYKEGDKRNRNERIENVVTVNGESFVEFLMEEKNNDTFDKAAVINGTTNVGGNVLGNSSVRNSLCGYDWTPGTQEVMATFGAQKLRQTADETGVIEELPMKFIVRAYYTRTANIDQTAPTTPVGYHAPSRGVDQAEDGKYYIAETTLDFTFTTQNLDEHTSIPSVIVDRQVTSVTYYNMMGQQDDKPFEGVNIVVTRYNDGTTTTAKVFK
jgi:hypothetical protein